MTHCQIILLHHSPSLAYSVLDQFEDSILRQQHKQYAVVQSKRTMAAHISDHSVLNGGYCDVARIVADFASPPLVIRKTAYDEVGGDPNQHQTSSVWLSFYDHFVGFNHHSLLEFASRNLRECNLSKTCFIQLFDEKEAHQMTVDDDLSAVYGFLTRLYSSAFERSFHLHLFAKHKRDGLYAASRRGRVSMYSEQLREGGSREKEEEQSVMKMKWMNVYRDGHFSSNRQLKNHQLTSFTSMKILERCLFTFIDKVPPMTMYDIGGSLSLISKVRLRLSVVKEIRTYIDPCYLTSDPFVGELLDHILRTKEKYQSTARLRTSYV